eukprot:452589_1
MGNCRSAEVAEQKLLNEKLKIWNTLNSSDVYNEAIDPHKPWIKMAPVPTSNISKPFQINDYEFIVFELQCIFNVYKYNSITKQWNQIMLNNTDPVLEPPFESSFIYTFNAVTNTLYVTEYQALNLYEINLNNARCIKHKISISLRNFWRVIICTDTELHLMGETQHFLWNITQSKTVNFKHIDNLLVHNCDELYCMRNMQCIYLKQEHKLIVFTVRFDVGIEIFEYSLCTKKWNFLHALPNMDNEFVFNILSCHNDQFILIIKLRDPEFIWIMDVKKNKIKPSSLGLINKSWYRYAITDESSVILNGFCKTVDIEYIPPDIIKQVHCFVGSFEYLHAIKMCTHWKVSVNEIIQ